jgi:YebC/PmpR family DNA-binding regulatory protein
MAGHSKWANIKHKKGKEDKARGKKFTQLIREITVAAQESGPDPSANPRLRLAIDKAQQANMPKDTINRAVLRGNGEQDSSSFEEVRYEGYAPCGVAVVVKCLTDNRNRTAGEIRHAFSKYGGNLGTDGSVVYMFDLKSVFHVVSELSEEDFFEQIIDLDVDDIVLEDGVFQVFSSTGEFVKIRDFFLSSEFKLDSADMCWVANQNITLDNDMAEKVAKLVEVLEDLDDVQAVFTNAVWPD